MSEEFATYSVYFNPLDYPGKYVGRRFINAEPTDVYFVSDNLEHVREWVWYHSGARGRVCDVMLMPSPEDHASLIEWYI